MTQRISPAPLPRKSIRSSETEDRTWTRGGQSRMFVPTSDSSILLMINWVFIASEGYSDSGHLFTARGEFLIR